MQLLNLEMGPRSNLDLSNSGRLAGADSRAAGHGPMFNDKPGHGVGIYWATEVVSLDFITSEHGKEILVLLLFHTFRDYLKLKTLCKCNYRCAN